MSGQIPDWADSVGPGWQPILSTLHEELLSIEPTYYVGQLKEKFGGLRVYLNGYEQGQVREAIMVAERLSYETCEECGAAGEARGPKERPHGWIRTVCDEHWT